MLERPACRANWTGRWAESVIWEPSLDRGKGSGQRLKGTDFFRWDAPQVLVSIGLGIRREEEEMAPRIWPGLGYRAGELASNLSLPSCSSPGTSAAPSDLSPRLYRACAGPSLTVSFLMGPGILVTKATCPARSMICTPGALELIPCSMTPIHFPGPSS